MKIKKKTPQQMEKDAATAEARQKIINDGQAMKRLQENPDFKKYQEILRYDRAKLLEGLLKENVNTLKGAECNMRLIARINQIDSCLKKPGSVIWIMKNLTEVRGAMKGRRKNPS